MTTSHKCYTWKRWLWEYCKTIINYQWGYILRCHWTFTSSHVHYTHTHTHRPHTLHGCDVWGVYCQLPFLIFVSFPPRDLTSCHRFPQVLCRGRRAPTVNSRLACLRSDSPPLFPPSLLWLWPERSSCCSWPTGLKSVDVEAAVFGIKTTVMWLQGLQQQAAHDGVQLQSLELIQGNNGTQLRVFREKPFVISHLKGGYNM